MFVIKQRELSTVLKLFLSLFPVYVFSQNAKITFSKIYYTKEKRRQPTFSIVTKTQRKINREIGSIRIDEIWKIVHRDPRLLSRAEFKNRRGRWFDGGKRGMESETRGRVSAGRFNPLIGRIDGRSSDLDTIAARRRVEDSRVYGRCIFSRRRRLVTGGRWRENRVNVRE